MFDMQVTISVMSHCITKKLQYLRMLSIKLIKLCMYSCVNIPQMWHYIFQQVWIDCQIVMRVFLDEYRHICQKFRFISRGSKVTNKWACTLVLWVRLMPFARICQTFAQMNCSTSLVLYIKEHLLWYFMFVCMVHLFIIWNSLVETNVYSQEAKLFPN